MQETLLSADNHIVRKGGYRIEGLSKHTSGEYYYKHLLTCGGVVVIGDDSCLRGVSLNPGAVYRMDLL